MGRQSNKKPAADKGGAKPKPKLQNAWDAFPLPDIREGDESDIEANAALITSSAIKSAKVPASVASNSTRAPASTIAGVISISLLERAPACRDESL